MQDKVNQQFQQRLQPQQTQQQQHKEPQQQKQQPQQQKQRPVEDNKPILISDDEDDNLLLQAMEDIEMQVTKNSNPVRPVFQKHTNLTSNKVQDQAFSNNNTRYQSGNSSESFQTKLQPQPASDTKSSSNVSSCSKTVSNQLANKSSLSTSKISTFFKTSPSLSCSNQSNASSTIPTKMQSSIKSFLPSKNVQGKFNCCLFGII